MALYDKIIEAFPELTIEAFYPENDMITVRDDADGTGEYIAKWNYEKPLTKELKALYRG
jgi:hypothetical protein